MPKVLTRGGKPLLKDGRVALTTDGTCCGPCGSGGGGGTCPTGTIQIAFSGISLCSGCLDFTPYGFGYSISNLTAIGVINGTFTLAGPGLDCGTPANPVWAYVTPDDRFNADIWNTSGCSGPPDGSQGNGLTAFARCINGVWTIFLLSSVSPWSLFYADGITNLASPISNQLGSGDCAGTSLDPNDICFPPVVDGVIGYGGSAVVTI
jgi:hypothetical protein